jgi:hypothetical protein
MTAFMQKTQPWAEIHVLNNWKLYYKVIFFSESCYSSGKCLQPIYLNSKHELDKAQLFTKLNWPNQDKPNEASFMIWRRYVKSCFINPSNNHIPPIGKWDLEAILTTSPWVCYFSPSQNNIYITQTQLGYKTYPATFVRRDQIAIPRYHVAQHTVSLASDSVPTDLQKTQYHIKSK